MILPATIRRLQATGANVYVVNVPAVTIPKDSVGPNVPAGDMQLPAYCEVFAMRTPAQSKCDSLNTFHERYNLPPATVQTVPASSIDTFTCHPK